MKRGEVRESGRLLPYSTGTATLICGTSTTIGFYLQGDRTSTLHAISFPPSQGETKAKSYLTSTDRGSYAEQRSNINAFCPRGPESTIFYQVRSVSFSNSSALDFFPSTSTSPPLLAAPGPSFTLFHCSPQAAKKAAMAHAAVIQKQFVSPST
jgi:hypothetical protein